MEPREELVAQAIANAFKQAAAFGGKQANGVLKGVPFDPTDLLRDAGLCSIQYDDKKGDVCVSWATRPDMTELEVRLARTAAVADVITYQRRVVEAWDAIKDALVDCHKPCVITTNVHLDESALGDILDWCCLELVKADEDWHNGQEVAHYTVQPLPSAPKCPVNTVVVTNGAGSITIDTH